jgi:hypothetical protein
MKCSLEVPTCALSKGKLFLLLHAETASTLALYKGPKGHTPGRRPPGGWPQILLTLRSLLAQRVAFKRRLNRSTSPSALSGASLAGTFAKPVAVPRAVFTTAATAMPPVPIAYTTGRARDVLPLSALRGQWCLDGKVCLGVRR